MSRDRVTVHVGPYAEFLVSEGAAVSRAGRELSWHREEGIRVHLFVRLAKKIQGAAAPFVYCGAVDFVDWEGDAPITVRWRLPEPVPEGLRTALDVPSERPS
jgi:Domain of unknown function (DUF3427)